MEAKKMGAWIRVSTDMQGDSPIHHEKRARLVAEAKGWDIKTVYHLEAVSGKSVMDHPETKRMLRDIQNGHITGLIFSKLARLARNTKELLEFADIFRDNNADLVSLEESIDTTSPAGRLFYTMIAAMAQWEREEIASRIAASVPIRAKLGKPLSGSMTYGYKWDGKQVVIVKEEATVRKLIYELFLKYKRKKAVARELTAMGYRTRDGSKFSDSTIQRLLRDTMAKGERIANFSTRSKDKKMLYKPQSEWVVTACPAIVPVELWNECNRILDEQRAKKERPGPRPKHLLAGYVFCQPCDKKMYVFHERSDKYVCRDCKTRMLASDLDDIYQEQLRDFLLTDTDVTDYIAKSDGWIKEKEELLSLTTEESANIKKQMTELVKMRTEGEMNKESFQEHYRPLEERWMQLENQKPELQAELDFLKIQYLSSEEVLSGARDLYNRWEKMEFEEKRTIVEIITQKITVGKDEINIKLIHLPGHTGTPTNSAPGGNGGKRQQSHILAAHLRTPP